MGDHNVIAAQEPDALRRFTRQLLQDVRALEFLLQEGAFESGTRRIGAEQELFLVGNRAGYHRECRMPDGAGIYIFEFNDRGRGPSVRSRSIRASRSRPTRWK